MRVNTTRLQLDFYLLYFPQILKTIVDFVLNLRETQQQQEIKQKRKSTSSEIEEQVTNFVDQKTLRERKSYNMVTNEKRDERAIFKSGLIHVPNAHMFLHVCRKLSYAHSF